MGNRGYGECDVRFICNSLGVFPFIPTFELYAELLEYWNSAQNGLGVKVHVLDVFVFYFFSILDFVRVDFLELYYIVWTDNEVRHIGLNLPEFEYCFVEYRNIIGNICNLRLYVTCYSN